MGEKVEVEYLLLCSNSDQNLPPATLAFILTLRLVLGSPPNHLPPLPACHPFSLFQFSTKIYRPLFRGMGWVETVNSGLLKYGTNSKRLQVDNNSIIIPFAPIHSPQRKCYKGILT
jgi:hypothetical protein